MNQEQKRPIAHIAGAVRGAPLETGTLARHPIASGLSSIVFEATGPGR